MWMATVLVEVVDHRGERRRLARSRSVPVTRRRPRGRSTRSTTDVGKTDLLEGQELVRDEAADHGVDALLPEGRDAEPRLVLVGEAEVGAPHLPELLELAGRDDLLDERRRLRRAQGGVVDVPQRPLETDGGRTSHGDVEVGGALLDDQVEEAVDVGALDRHARLTPRSSVATPLPVDGTLVYPLVAVSSPVTRRISSIVVVPASTLRTPSWRRLRSPPLRRACSRISWVLAAPERDLAGLRVHREQLEEPDAALVALEAALPAAHGTVDRPPLDVRLARGRPRRGGRARASRAAGS